MNRTLLTLCTALVLLLPVMQAGAATMVGQWTFDGTGGSGALDNKAPAAEWQTMTVWGEGAGVVDGRLVLPRYYGTNQVGTPNTWVQSTANTMLTTDFGAGNYFREVTEVMWIHWPGFVSNNSFQRLLTLNKFNANAYNVYNGTSKSYEGITYDARPATENCWLMHELAELNTGAAQGNWIYHKNNLIDPPSDRLIKIVHTLKLNPADTTKFISSFYIDYADGEGLKSLPQTGTFWAAWAMYWGQAGSDSIPYPAGGARYDGLGLMDYSWTVPASVGQIEFEEVRIYAGALTMEEAAGLVPVPEPSALAALIGGAVGLLFTHRRRK